MVKFCGCFGDNKSRFSLSAKKIYKKTPLALEAFNYTKNLRDKHIVHDDNNCHFSVTCAVLDDDDTLIDVVSLKMQFFPDWGFYQNLFTLIDDAQKYVLSEIDTVRQNVFDEVTALSTSERARFPDVEHRFPVVSDISQTRE